MEANTTYLISVIIFSILYISFWIYVLKIKYPKELKEKKTYILKEFDEENEIFILDLVNNKNIIISKLFEWRYENNMFIKGDRFITLEELTNPDLYKVIENKHF